MPEKDLTAVPPRGGSPGNHALRRGLTLSSAAVLLPATHALWAAAAAPPLPGSGSLVPPPVLHGTLVIVTIVLFAALLAAAALALGARGRLLPRLDLALLGCGVVLAVGRFLLDHAPNDEGALTGRAATALLHGQPVYGASWPSLFTVLPLTKTMSGGDDTSYGYPPLGVLLTSTTAAVLHSATIAAPLVTMLAFLIIAVALWLAVPTPWRPVVTIVVLGLDDLAMFARGGSPALLAVALLLPVLLRLHTLGAGGRLGPTGLLRAACLGAACAAHQLSWFLLPFLLVVLLGMRIAELGARRALVLLVRLLAAAAAVWLAIDLPFAITQRSAWLHGILLPLDQHAIVHGQGIVDLPYLVTGGSGALDLLTGATVALLAALLVATWLLPGRFGPAFAVSPVAVFLLATRGSVDYWVQFTPLWLAVAATVPLTAFRTSWRPAFVDRVPLPARAAALAALAVPSVVLAVVAVTTPPPLRMELTALLKWPHTAARIGEVDLIAVNVSTHPVSPHFAWRPTGSASDWWRIVQGPRTLAPGARGSYVLAPGTKPLALVPDSVLLAVSDRPMTITNLPLPDTFTGTR